MPRIKYSKVKESKYLLLVGLALLIQACTRPAYKEAEGAASLKPNIVFILADDLGYNELSCYGQENFSTPNIDQLAAEGMRFTDFYAGNTVCAPSRASLMTGRDPGHCSIRGNWGWENQDPTRRRRVGISAEDRTIGEVLQKAGYVTAHCGKWHLETAAEDSLINWPHFRGYHSVIREHFTEDVKRQRAAYLAETGIHFNPNYPYELWENGRRIPITENLQGKTTYLMDDITTDYGLDFIRKHKNDPFFVFFSMKIPHAPETLHTLDTLFQDKGWPECARVHAARIVYHDQMVGRIVKLIDSLGLSEQTIIMYSSDNGGHSEGTHRLRPRTIDPCKHDHTFFQSNAPLRGFKRDLYDGGIRVPFIVRWKNTIKANTTSKHIGAFWDILATLSALSDAELDEYEHDGVSFLPELLGNEQAKHEYLYWEFFQQGKEEIKFRQAIRMGNFKAVRYEHHREIELYNLDTDIGETQEISHLYPALMQQIDSLMTNSRTPHPYFPYGGVSLR